MSRRSACVRAFGRSSPVSPPSFSVSSCIGIKSRFSIILRWTILQRQASPRAGKIARVTPEVNLDTRTEMGPATHPAWRRVQLARHPKRPHSLDYIGRIFTDFQEFHGDRAFGDDPAIVAGSAQFAGRPVMVVAEQKGRDTKQRFFRNFGMPKPEGYRKALRVMQMAAKFGRPIITLLDTPGAYPGIDAEERGQAEAIARNLPETLGRAT